MSRKDYSGPAFPSDTGNYGPVLGMSLRDYFAAKALQGILASPQIQGNEDTLNDWVPEHFAEFAFRIADAMLEERAP